MCAHEPRVIFQTLKPNGVVRSRNRFIESFEGHLRVNDDGAISRQAHNDVGANAAIFICDGFLFGEVAVLDHPGEFHDATQLNLAPTAAHVRSSERFDQVAGLSL